MHMHRISDYCSDVLACLVGLAPWAAAPTSPPLSPALGRKRVLSMYKIKRDLSSSGDRGSSVVKVLCYKSECRWFDPSWCQWIFH